MRVRIVSVLKSLAWIGLLVAAALPVHASLSSTTLLNAPPLLEASSAPAPSIGLLGMLILVLLVIVVAVIGIRIVQSGAPD